jgi:hypothetical protein
MGALGLFLVHDFFEHFLFGFKSHLWFSSWHLGAPVGATVQLSLLIWGG